jgi:tRNA pseudouridine38-40 synthase
VPITSYKAIVVYDGTHYYGWQKAEPHKTIQGEIEKAIAQTTGENSLPEAASRTDRGVHALGQVIRFTLEKAKSPQQLHRSLNAVLPCDIRIVQLEECDFHPTLDAIGKKYFYSFDLSPVPDPMRRLYAWHIYLPLDLEKMINASSHLVGTHDFTAFTNDSSVTITPEKNPTCTLQSIEITPEGILIHGNRFLYKMVRNIVGTLVYIGSGKLSADCIPNILVSRDRKQAGVTAPAHGLYLHQVLY